MRHVLCTLICLIFVQSVCLAENPTHGNPTTGPANRAIANLTFLRGLVQGPMSPPMVNLDSGAVARLSYNSEGRLTLMTIDGSSVALSIVWGSHGSGVTELRLTDSRDGSLLRSLRLPDESAACSQSGPRGKNGNKFLTPEEEEEQWARDFLASLEMGGFDPWGYILEWDYLTWAQRDERERERCTADCQNRCDIDAAAATAVCGLATAVLGGARQAVASALVAGGCAVGIPIWRYSCRDRCPERCR